MTLTKAGLKRVGMSALGGMSDAQIRADPVTAMTVAMAAMRATVAARDKAASERARTASG